MYELFPLYHSDLVVIGNNLIHQSPDPYLQVVRKMVILFNT